MNNMMSKLMVKMTLLSTKKLHKPGKPRSSAEYTGKSLAKSFLGIRSTNIKSPPNLTFGLHFKNRFSHPIEMSYL